jgi:cardiolipin synthase
MNLPNALTALRMALIPLFVWAFYQVGPGVALVIYLLAAATDWLDGFLARRWNQVTSFGKLADPLADKLMLLTMLFCMGQSGRVPWWVLGVMLGKELLMVIGSVFLLKRHNVVVMANWLGKTATVAFILAVVAVFPWHEWNMLYQTGLILMYMATGLSLASMVVYAMSYIGASRVK